MDKRLIKYALIDKPLPPIRLNTVNFEAAEPVEAVDVVFGFTVAVDGAAGMVDDGGRTTLPP